MQQLPLNLNFARLVCLTFVFHIAHAIAQDWSFPPAALRQQAPEGSQALVVAHSEGGYLGLAFHDFRLSTTHFGDAVETDTETVVNAPATIVSARPFQTGILVKDVGGVSWFDYSGQRIWKRGDYMHVVVQADPDVLLMHNEFLLYGLSTNDGQTLWTSNAIDEDSLQSSASSGDVTYLSEFQNNLRTRLTALNHRTGTLLWRSETQPARGLSPIITDTCVLVFTKDVQAASDRLECYAKKDGTLRSSTAFDLPEAHISAVLNGDQTLVAFHSNMSTQSFGAVGLKGGKIIWRQAFSSDTRGAVLAPDGSFYRFAYLQTTNDLMIERRRLSDGDVTWSALASTTHELDGQYHVSTNHAYLDVAAFGTNRQTSTPEWIVQRIDATTGSPVGLTAVTSQAESRGNNGVAMFGDQVFAAEVLDAPNSMLIVRAGDALTGAVQWQRQFDCLAAFDETPTVTANTDYLTVRNLDEIFRLSRSNGELIWRYRTPGLISVLNAKDFSYLTLSQEVLQLNAAGEPQLSIPNASAMGTIGRDVITRDAAQLVRRNATGKPLWALNYPTALIASAMFDANNDMYLLHRQFGQLAKINGTTGEILWSETYGPSSMSNMTQRLVFLGDGTGFLRTISGSSSYSYFRIALSSGAIIGSLFPPSNALRVFALPISPNSKNFLAPATTNSMQSLLGQVDKPTLSWRGQQDFTSPKITDLIGMDRSDSFLGLTPDGGILIRRDHFFQSNTDQSQIWLERFPTSSEIVTGELTLAQINSSNNTFSDGVIKLRVHNNSSQMANNIALSASADRFLGCRKSSGLPCNLRRTDVGSMHFDLTQNEYADFDFLRVLLPNCAPSFIAKVQPDSEYVDSTISDNHLEIRFCDRFGSGFE